MNLNGDLDGNEKIDNLYHKIIIIEEQKSQEQNSEYPCKTFIWVFLQTIFHHLVSGYSILLERFCKWSQAST